MEVLLTEVGALPWARRHPQELLRSTVTPGDRLDAGAFTTFIFAACG